MASDFAADKDQDLHLYAKGDKAKCWKENGDTKLVCEVENGSIQGYEGSPKWFGFPVQNRTGRCWMTKDDHDCVWMAWS